MNNFLDVKCPDCGSKKNQNLGLLESRTTFADIKIVPFFSHLYRCLACHIGFRYPRLAPEKMLYLYSSAELKVWKQIEPLAPWKKIYLTLQDISPKSILDFGCFAGDFLRLLPVQCRKYGIEPSVEGTQEAKCQGIEMLGQSVSDIPAILRFDAITLLDVIEHVEQPTALMRELAESLNPGGFLFVLSGAFDGLWFRLLAARFWYCNIAEHLVFINRKWSVKFAEAHNLTLVSYELIAYHPKSRSKKLVEIARALVYGYVVPILLNIPNIAKIVGMRRFLLWKTAPSTFSCKDHVIAIFQKNENK